MVYNTQNYWGFQLFTFSSILENINKTFQKLKLFPSSVDGEDTYTDGPLRKSYGEISSF
jgi:hypothetical protein